MAKDVVKMINFSTANIIIGPASHNAGNNLYRWSLTITPGYMKNRINIFKFSLGL